MTPNWTQMTWPEKHPTCAVPRNASPKFSSVSLYGQPLSIYCIFYGFSFDTHVKFQSVTKCLKFGRLLSTVIAMVANVLINFDWHWLKTVGGVPFWIVPALYGPLLTKNSECHIICNFWQITKTFITLYSSITTLVMVKFCSDRMKIVGKVAFWNVCSHRVPC